MRKSRNVVRDIEDKLAAQLSVNPTEIIDALKGMDIVVPSWASMVFAFVRETKKLIELSCFEDPKDFFLWYSRVMISKPEDMKVVSYSKQDDQWKLFLPPTLIGVNLETRLRF
jgi:hypothetical protein